MLLKLSLPKGKVIWALAHPVSKEYIHQVSGIGYQQSQLIIREGQPPVEIELDDYPEWARIMIVSSIRYGDLINTAPVIQIVKEISEPPQVVETPKTEPVKKASSTKKPKMSKDVKPNTVSNARK